MLLMDQGPAKRLGLPTAETPRVPASVLEEGQTADNPLAEHGFSALIDVHSSGRAHSVLFDSGFTPIGLVEYLRTFGHSPKDNEAIMMSLRTLAHTYDSDDQ